MIVAQLAGALVLTVLLGQAQQRDTSATAAVLTIGTGVAPETVTVGDRFRSYVRVRLPPGATAELGGFPPNDSLQLVDSIAIIAREEGGAHGLAGVYPLVAWIAGEPLRQAVKVDVTLAGGERRSYSAPLRLPIVRSVLPADSAELRPRPPKGFLLALPSGSRWWWLLLIPAAVAAGWLARRLLARAAKAAPSDPRVDALARLDRLGEAGPATAGDPYYTSVVRILREYLARVDGRLGEELTTTELLAELERGGVGTLDRAALARLLHHADPVKFGAVVPDPDEMRRFWTEARVWIQTNPAAPGAREVAA